MNKRIWWVCVGLFCLLHVGILLFNFVQVPPTQGYDWPGHMAYLQYVSDHWQSPSAQETPQFFNPPLYYFSAAALHKISGLELGRAAQVLNLILAIGTLGLLVAINHRLWKGQLLPGVWFIAFYVLNPTIYRTFGMVRPEPMLLPLFAGAGWLIVSNTLAWKKVALASGCLAGLAFGVRQWGAFLEVALLLWLFVSYWQTQPGQTLRQIITRRSLWIYLGLQTISFAALAVLFLIVRGGEALAFNTTPHWPDPAFMTRTGLAALFSTPVRPALDDHFWPVLYADFWGDYWRYWRETLGRDPMPTSPAIVASLARSMWAALPASALVIAGLFLNGKKLDEQDRLARSTMHNLARSLVIVSLAGFLAFASVYGEPGKGDSVKSIYLVYLVPFLGWLSSTAVYALARRMSLRYGQVALLLPLLLLIIFVLPNCFYLPTTELVNRTWEKPALQCPLDTSFEKIKLSGYTLHFDLASGELNIALIWTTNAYVGTNYKVFVHLIDANGQLIAQSDAIPANWQRATTSWLPGEYITDSHTLGFEPSGEFQPLQILVGLYDENNQRLSTLSGGDHIVIPLNPCD